MKNIYNVNSLVTYDEQEILEREYLNKVLECSVKKTLLKQNKAWSFHRIESPSLMPIAMISDNYTSDDYFCVQNNFNTPLALKPETTSASYAWAKYHLSHSSILPPMCIWQCSKSFRQEQEHTMAHMRLKEFYQTEFQCIYSSESKNDYQMSTLDDIADMFMKITTLPTRIVYSERLPHYSLKTIDIEVKTPLKWLEVASISLRKDFIFEDLIKDKNMNFLVLEIATSTDRLSWARSVALEVNNLKVIKEI